MKQNNKKNNLIIITVVVIFSFFYICGITGLFKKIINPKSDFMILTNGENKIFTEKLKKFAKDNKIDVDFEYTTVRVPVGYERLLKSTWPNYATPYIDYDSHSYPYYREMEKELKDLSGITELIMDFSALEYISSAGLRLLLSLEKIMSRQGGMKVTHVNDIVNEVFEVTGFSDILTIE